MAGNSGDPDMALVGELLEDIARNPPAVGARKLLVEHYISVGWLDAAREDAKELKSIAPLDQDVTHFLSVLEKKPEPPAPEEKKPVSVSSASVTEARVWDPKLGRYKKKTDHSKPVKKLDSLAPTIVLGHDLDIPRDEFSTGYQVLRTKARYVLTDLLHLQTLQKKAGLPTSKHTAKIQTIAQGRNLGTPLKSGQPGSARSVARTIKDNPTEATSLAISDLEGTMKWLRQSSGKSSGSDDDSIRDALVKRKNALESALPDDLKLHCDLALMHIEHEHLQRNYVNTETMLGDEVKDIPRVNFLVTEDNYAWDIEELVQAITVGRGVFRNPLSKEMFTPKDVKCILIHPSGKRLAALAVEQHEMSKGIRAQTIDEMEKLSKILLDDQTSDALPSRKAVDEFLAYIATLPDLEQKAVEYFKCPAKDSHTGQAYDLSIGEAVRNAKANKICFHKSADFIKQAATHLRQNRGVAPDPDKCTLM